MYPIYPVPEVYQYLTIPASKAGSPSIPHEENIAKLNRSLDNFPSGWEIDLKGLAQGLKLNHRSCSTYLGKGYRKDVIMERSNAGYVNKWRKA